MTGATNWRAERAQLVARLQAGMPQAMRDLPQWLVWRKVHLPGRPKPAKTPFYINGRLRGWPCGRPSDGLPTQAQPHAELGGELDRAHLATFDEACMRIQEVREFDGVGFAFLDGDGLIGIDLDWKETGAPSAEQTAIMECATSFAEWSPSGLGVHIIVSGLCDSFKHDDVGVEVYCGGRYFTCTGQRLDGAPADVLPLKPYALAYMQQVVQAAKDAAKAARQPTAVAAPAPAAAAVARPARAAGQWEKFDDFRRVNAAALDRLDSWVPEVFARATRATYGWRVTSKALGRDLQEDLQLAPEGIMDFGEERGYSAIDCVLRWAPGVAASPRDAMLWLASRCGVQVQQRSQRVAPPPPPPHPQPPELQPQPMPTRHHAADDHGRDDQDMDDDAWAEAAEAAALDGQGPAENAADAPAPHGGGGGADVPPGSGDAAEPDAPGKKPRKRKEYPPEFWDAIDRMLERFALVYGSNQVWDLDMARFVEVPHLRLAFGAGVVNFWLASARRRMVYPEDLVFEPGVDVPEGKINLFQGIKLKPVPCTSEEVAPMLRLLRHLCSTSVLVGGGDGDDDTQAAQADDVDAVMHWVLCWQAYPHQHLGAKMRTALIFHGSQGTGKNLFFDAWRDTFGELGKTVGQTELEEKYNAGWLSRTLAIVGDEVVSKSELYHNKNRLKMIVTQEHRFPIRSMYADVRYETNHANVVFTSNEDMPLALEDRDRRYLVVYTPLEADGALYDEVKRFLQGDGVAKWLYYLQHYPLGEFDRHTKPLMTRAKQLLIEANWKPSQRFAAEWTGGYLDLPRRACSREQIYRAFKRWVENTGVKWAADQATFVREINRWATEQRGRDAGGVLKPPPFELRKVRMPMVLGEREVGERQFVWMLIHLPGGPVAGVSIGDWAVESIREFATPLNRYCGHTGRPPLPASDGGDS